MAYEKQLGVFVRVPQAGKVKTRLSPPLSHEQACQLYTAFVRDLFARVEKLKKVYGTVFYAGGDPDRLIGLIAKSYEIRPQQGDTLGDRLAAAFERLLGGEGRMAVIIGSDSPDVPIQYIKRAFLRLKQKDVVLGPAADGGYYLVGLRTPAPEIFDGVDWGKSSVLGQTLQRIKARDLSLSLLPLWYDVDTPASLELLRDMIRARRIERSGRLMATEEALANLFHHGCQSD
jgi:rSAM/selenodomain-associated transferase 1